MAVPLLLILSAVGTAATIASQKKAAQIQEAEIIRQAEQEKISAEGRELARRQKLNKILSANIVGQSMSGMTGEGTPESIALSNAKQVSLSEGLEGLSERLKQAQMKRQAANVRSMGNIQAASTLLKGASKIEELS